MPLSCVSPLEVILHRLITLRSTHTSPLAGVVLLLLVLALAAGVQAKVILAEGSATGDNPEDVFSAIAMAWENGDEHALADLVHPEGLRVTQGDYDRFTNYSPSQAFYYFKNQFHKHPTVSFELKRLPQSQERNDRVHGMVVWKFRRSGVKADQELKLVLVLIRHEGLWRMAEINRITKR